MAQRVRIPHRGQGPSSVTQLPILTALHARFPTLFPLIIHDVPKKVNRYFYIFINDCLYYQQDYRTVCHCEARSAVAIS